MNGEYTQNWIILFLMQVSWSTAFKTFHSASEVMFIASRSAESEKQIVITRNTWKRVDDSSKFR